MSVKKKAVKKKVAKVPAKMGRPTKYKPEFCEMVIQHMKKGLSFESFAGKIEVSVETIYEWARSNDKFSEAKRLARAQCQLFWEEMGIAGTADSKDFSASMWIFNTKCRFPKTFRDTVEVVTRDETLKLPETMTEDQLDDRLSHALKVVDLYESRASKNPNTRKAKTDSKKEANGGGSN